MEILALTQTLTPTGKESALNLTYRSNEGEVQSLSVSKESAVWPKVEPLMAQLKASKLDQAAFVTQLVHEADLAKRAAEKIHRVSDVLNGAMTVRGGHIFVDYEPIDAALESHVLSMLREDGTPEDDTNWKAFALFLNKLFANANPQVREQLYGWLQFENDDKNGFTLTDEGDLLGYKGCQPGAKGVAHSISQGTAIVDGVSHSGPIPNPLGALVEMPRSQVTDDPNKGCAPGLHVGTHSYASNWAQGILLTVSVNPVDVVSVPRSDAQKMRVCRYRVLEAISKPVKTRTYSSPRGVDNPNTLRTLEDAAKSGNLIRFTYHSTPRKGVVISLESGKGGEIVHLNELDDQSTLVKSYSVRKISDLISDPEELGALDLVGHQVKFTYQGQNHLGMLKSTPRGRKGCYLHVQTHQGLIRNYSLQLVSDLEEVVIDSRPTATVKGTNSESTLDGAQPKSPVSMLRFLNKPIVFVHGGVAHMGMLTSVHGPNVTIRDEQGELNSYLASEITDMNLRVAFS